MSQEVEVVRNDLSDLVSITPHDVDSLDTDKLSDALLKSLYIVNSALLSNAGNEVSRLNKFKDALSYIEDEITSRDYIDSLDREEKIAIYKLIQANSSKSTEYLIKLSTSMSSGLDSISKIKAVKSHKRKSPIPIPENKSDRNEMLKAVKSEIERRKHS